MYCSLVVKWGGRSSTGSGQALVITDVNCRTQREQLWGDE